MALLKSSPLQSQLVSQLASCVHVLHLLQETTTLSTRYHLICAGPTNVEIYGLMPDYLAGSDISLQCSWDTSVYYKAWYKNGVLIYGEDLAASSVLMGPPQGLSVDSNYATMMSTLTIVSVALDDSGSYTCAVTCGVKGVEFGMIAGNLTDTAEVFVYGKLYGAKYCISSHNAMVPSNYSVHVVITFRRTSQYARWS